MSLLTFLNGNIVSPEVHALFHRFEIRDGLEHGDTEILFKEISRLQSRILAAQVLFVHLQRTETYPSCCFNDFSDKVKAWLTATPNPAAQESEFTHKDSDLNDLLNATAMMLSGNANMDVGIFWEKALNAVEGRLRPREETNSDDFEIPRRRSKNDCRLCTSPTNPRVYCIEHECYISADDKCLGKLD